MNAETRTRWADILTELRMQGHGNHEAVNMLEAAEENVPDKIETTTVSLPE